LQYFNIYQNLKTIFVISSIYPFECVDPQTVKVLVTWLVEQKKLNDTDLNSRPI